MCGFRFDLPPMFGIFIDYPQIYVHFVGVVGFHLCAHWKNCNDELITLL